MSTSLEDLRDWAMSMAETDDDEGARALWAQIAGEVGEYLGGPDEHAPQDDLWGAL